MGNSNGRSCGSFGGTYGATGFAPAAHVDEKSADSHKFAVEIVFPPVAAVSEAKDAEGKVTTHAVAAKGPEVKNATVSVAKGHVKVGELLASILSSWDHELDTKEDEEHKKIAEQTKKRGEAEEKNKNESDAKKKKDPKAIEAEFPIQSATDFECQRTALRKYKPGWVVIHEHKTKETKEGKEVEAKVETVVTHELETDVSKVPDGTRIIFAFHEAVEVPQGHKAPPPKPAAGAAAGAGAGAGAGATGAGATATPAPAKAAGEAPKSD